MKRFLFSALSFALLCVPAARASAQDEMKPMVVLSFTGYDQLIEDIDLVGTATGNPDLGQGIEGLLQLMTQGQGLVSLDKSKPWGAAVSSDGVQFQVLGFLPISDLEKFLGVLAALGQPEEVGDGVWRMDAQGQTAYFKQNGDWTYVSMGPEFLTNLPDDPTPMLGGLQDQYDFAARIHFANIPEIFRQLAIEQAKITLEQGLDEAALPPVPGLENVPIPELPPQAELARKVAEGQIDSFISMLNETDHITFGFTIDGEQKKTVVDIEMAAIEGTKAATDLGRLHGLTSRFSGFFQPEAAMSTQMTSVLSNEEIEMAVASVHTLRDEAMTGLDGIEQLNDEYIRSTVKDFVGEMFDIMEASVRTGRVDMGMSLAGEGPFTFVYGGAVADGTQVTALIDKFIETVETEVGFYGFERNVEKIDDVSFHRVIAPVPGGEEGDRFAELFGDNLELVLAVGDTSFYMGLGEGGMDMIKEQMAKSKELADEPVQPMRVTARLNPLLGLATQLDDSDPTLSALAAALEDDEDRVNVDVKPTENGVHIQLVGELGLMKLATVLAGSLGPGVGLPQF